MRWPTEITLADPVSPQTPEPGLGNNVRAGWEDKPHRCPNCHSVGDVVLRNFYNVTTDPSKQSDYPEIYRCSHDGMVWGFPAVRVVCPEHPNG